MSSPRISHRSVLLLRPVFEGAGEPGIFSSARIQEEAKLGIFPSPRAYMEEIVVAKANFYFIHISS